MKGTKRPRPANEVSSDSEKEDPKNPENIVKKAKKAANLPPKMPDISEAQQAQQHQQAFDPRLWWAAATAASANSDMNSALGDGSSSVGSGPLMSPGLWKTPNSSNMGNISWVTKGLFRRNKTLGSATVKALCNKLFIDKCAAAHIL